MQQDKCEDCGGRGGEYVIKVQNPKPLSSGKIQAELVDANHWSVCKQCRGTGSVNNACSYKRRG